MEKYLYFAVSAPNDSGANEQVIMVPASNVSHFEIAETTKLDVFFKGIVGQETNTGDGDIHVDHAKVRLLITVNKHKEVMEAIVENINSNHSNGFIVIADDENDVFASTNITACESITIIDAS